MTGKQVPATSQDKKLVTDMFQFPRERLVYIGKLWLTVVLLSTAVTILGSVVAPGETFYTQIAIWLVCAVAFLASGGGGALVGIGAYMRASSFLFANLPKRRYHEIERKVRQAYVIVQRMPKVYRQPYSAVTLSNIALMRLYMGDYESAETIFREAHALIAHGRYDKYLMSPLITNNLAVALCLNGKFFEAEELANKALELWKLQAKDHRVASCMSHLILSSICLSMSELDRAQEEAQKFLSMSDAGKFPAVFSKDSLLQAKANATLILSIAYAKQKHFGLAKESTDKFLGMTAASPHCVSTMTMRHINLLTEELLAVQEYARAEKLLEISYAIGREFHHHPEAIKMTERYEQLLLATDRGADVADMKRWIRPLAYELVIASDR